MNKQCLLLLYFFLQTLFIHSQNLLSNGGFENSNPLPTGLEQLDNADDWTCLIKTCDLLNELTFPNHSWAFQQEAGANSGESYVGLYGNQGEFEAIIQELNAPLIANETYEFNAYAKRSITPFLESCLPQIRVYGLNEMIPYTFGNAELNDFPEATLLWASEEFTTFTWENISGSFSPSESFSYIAITGSICTNFTSSYFFLDDVELTTTSISPPPNNGCGKASYAGRGGISGSNLFNPQIIANGSSPVISFYQANFTTDVNTLLQLDEAGNIEWAKTYQYPNSVRSNDVVATADGGLVNISSLSNNLDVQKVNEQGDFLWARRYNNPNNNASISSLVTNDNNELLISGVLGTVFNGDPDGFLLKTNAEGEVTWSKKYIAQPLPGEGNNCLFSDVIESNNGGYILTGRANGFPLIAEISVNGNLAWSRIFDEDMPLTERTLALNHNNNGFYLLYNGGSLLSETIKIVEFGANGNFLRGREFTAPGLGTDPGHLVVQSNGNIIIHGDYDNGNNAEAAPFFLLLNENWDILDARIFDNYADEEVSNTFGKTFTEINDELVAVHFLFDGNFDFSILKVQNDLTTDCESASLDFSFSDFSFPVENIIINVTNEPLSSQTITPTVLNENINQSFVCNELGNTNFTDVSLNSIESECNNGVVLIQFEVCNEGTTEIPIGLPTTFYDSNPLTSFAAVIEETATEIPILPNDCATQAIFWTGGSTVFAVVNADETQSPPFDLAATFTGAAFEECNYENNFAETTVANANAEILELGNDIFSCQVQSVLLDASENFETYLWNTGAATSQIMVDQSDVYWVEVTDDCGLIQIDTIEVNFGGANPVDLGEDLVICAGESVFLDAGNYASYQWSENPDGSCETCQLFVFLAVVDELVTVEVTDFDGCVSTDTLFVDTNGGSVGSDNSSICEGESVEINGNTISNDTSFFFFTETVIGCDSIVFVSVSVVNDIATSEIQQFCEGQTATVFGNSYTSNTIISETFDSQNGCDSTHEVTLIFSPPDSTFNLFQPCAGEIIIVDGFTVTEDAVFTTNTVDPSGCISYVETIVDFLENGSTSETQEFCDGTSVEINQTIYTTDATIEITLTAVNGCDSIHTIDLVFVENFNTSENLQFCEGDTATVFGQIVTENVTLEEIFIAENGCDSTHSINIDFFPAAFTSEIVQACFGQPIEVAGTTVFNDTIIILDLISFANCDSTHQIEVLFLEEIMTEETQQFCQGDMVTISGVEYTENTLVVQELTSQNGCDSVHVIALIFNPNVNTNALIESCEGESVTVFGNEITENQIISASFQSFGGCDSTHTVEVIFQETALTSEIQEFCQGDTIEIFGNIVTENDLISSTFTGENGCDSLHEITVIFNEIIEINRSETLCPDDFLIFMNDTIREAGTYQNITPATTDNCEIRETVTVDFSPVFDFDLPADTLIERGSFFQIPLITTISNLSFDWGNTELLSCTNCQQPTTILDAATTFSVFILDENNCFQQASITIQVREKEQIAIPNVFSPNNDGINDFFTIYSNNDNTVVESMQIFNRWGGLIFEAENVNLNTINSGWDGTFNGELMESAVFVYQIKVRLEDGLEELYEGDVLLLR